MIFSFYHRKPWVNTYFTDIISQFQHVMEKLKLMLNPKKTKIVDMNHESFDFLGFRYQYSSFEQIFLDIKQVFFDSTLLNHFKGYAINTSTSFVFPLLLSMTATIYLGDEHGHTTHEIYVAYSFWLLDIDYVKVVEIFLFSVWCPLSGMHYPLPSR
jgi:hypothetical protein